MLYLPTIPSRQTFSHKVLMSQQLPTKYFTANASTQQNVLLGIPAGFTVTGVKIDLLTQFVVPGSTSFTMSLGLVEDGIHAVKHQFYATTFELTSAASNTSHQVTHADFGDTPGPGTAFVESAHDIVAYFIANGGGFISGTSQGEVEVTIQYRPM